MKVLLKSLCLLSLLLGMNVNVCVAAPTPEKAPLCDLQRTAKQGEHRAVQVSGIYSAGFEGSVLTDAACPSQYTWVELDLKSTANKEKLRSMLDKAGKAEVVFEGEFYGPGMPDPKLPEAIRKSYQPGWGHLAAFKTKLVVHAIREVKAAPHQTSSTIEILPAVAGAAVPFYPPLARVARVYGTVEVAGGPPFPFRPLRNVGTGNFGVGSFTRHELRLRPVIQFHHSWLTTGIRSIAAPFP